MKNKERPFYHDLGASRKFFHAEISYLPTNKGLGKGSILIILLRMTLIYFRKLKKD